MADPSKSPAEDRKTPQPDAAAAVTAFAMADPSLARLYANGFTLGLTNADVYIILQMFGRPTGVVNLSYTLAKTLSMKLEKLVKDWELKTGNELATTDTIDQAFGLKAQPKE
jgi:hypothetical protein